MTPSPTDRSLTGEMGETAAAEFFKSLGYVVLVRNWRSGRDEIDLVLREPRTRVVVFVEVKTRAASDPKGGYAAVDSRKRHALKRVIRTYLRCAGGGQTSFRFDIAEVRVEGAGALRVIHHCAVPLFS